MQLIKENILSLIIFSLFLFSQLEAISNEITINNNPTSGYLFLEPSIDFSTISCYDHFLKRPFKATIKTEFNTQLLDLKTMPDGRFIGYLSPKNMWLIFDEDFKTVDSVKLNQHYDCDFHDIQFMPNGNYLIIAIDKLTVDMSKIVTGGRKNASVRNMLILEVNPSMDVVWEWSAIEHFNITDATENISLTETYVNPFHINSLFVDRDTNIIVSARHLDAVFKINHSTGDVIWVLGGSKSKVNQFAISNDTKDGFIGFSHQHHVTRLSNGNLLMFDNGNLKPSPESRAVEYSINEANLTVTKVWEHKHTPSVYSASMGSVQRLYNGNTLIGWGGSDDGSGLFIASEVTSSGEVALDIMGENGCYRAFKYKFKMDFVDNNVTGTGEYNFNDNNNTTGVKLNISSISGTGNINIEKHRYQPHNITISDGNACKILPLRWVIHQDDAISTINSTIKLDLTTINNIIDPTKLIIYYRNTENDGSFSPIITNYNSGSNTISGQITGPCEIMLVEDDYIAPVQYFPMNRAAGVSINPTFTWKANKQGEQYQLQIALDSGFSQPVLDTSQFVDNRLAVQNLTESTKYYWRVKAKTSDCESTWSRIRTFSTTIAAPYLISPSHKEVNVHTEVFLKWSWVEMASKYRLQISEDNAFSKIVLDKEIINTTEYQFPNLRNNQTYYWRVAGMEDYQGRWSEIFSFRTILATTSLISPVNDKRGIAINDYVRWSAVEGANFYNVLIAHDNQFREIILDSTGISGTEMILRNLSHLNNYYWKVKAVNDQSMSDWTDAWSFRTTMPEPILIHPYNQELKEKISGAMSWGHVPEANDYEVWISKDSSFNLNVQKLNSVFNSVNFSNLDYSTDYYWRVRARNNDGYSDWSKIFYFRTMKNGEIASPDLTKPGDNSYRNNINLTLSWLTIPNADSYSIELSSDEGFSNIIRTEATLKTNELEIRDLQFNQKYFWRVRTIAGENKSEWSPTWNFTTLLKPVSLISPANESININTGSVFIWDQVDGALLYDLQIANDEEFENIIFSRYDIHENQSTTDGLESDKTYYWRIMAKNQDNISDWSSPAKFRTAIINDVTATTENRYSLFPNPANDIITLFCHSEMTFPLSIRIFNAEGKLVLDYHNIMIADNININLDDIPAGVYFIRVTTAQSSQMLPFVKQ
jgi:hypothetical protein